MAKIYALAQQVGNNASLPSIKARLQGPGDIRCSDCGELVPLLELGSHICSVDAIERKRSPSNTPSEEEPPDLLLGKHAKPFGLKIQTAPAKKYSGMLALSTLIL